MSIGVYGDGRSMRGSGSDSGDYSGWFYCSGCEKDFELDGRTDDWGSTATADCPECESELEVEIPSKEERERDYWADYK